MNKKKISVFPVAALFLIIGLISGLISGCASLKAAFEEPPRMTKEELRASLGDEDVVVIDVRHGVDWEKSDHRIKGSIREDPEDVRSWAGNYPRDKTLVLY